MPGPYTLTLDEGRNGFDYPTGDPSNPTNHLDPGETTPELNACQFLSAVDAAIASNPGAGGITGVDMDKVQEECYSTVISAGPSTAPDSPPTEADPATFGGDSATQQGAPTPPVLGTVGAGPDEKLNPPPTEEPLRPPLGAPHPTHSREQAHEQTYAGDPIDLFNGALTLQETDLTIPNTTLPMSFLRLYRSSAASFGPFGWNWDHSFNMFIRELATGAVAVWTNLHEHIYHPDAAGAFQPPPGIFQKLERTASVTQVFELSGEGGVVMRFERPSNYIDVERIPLLWIKDRHGNRLDFSYGPEAKLSHVIDENGRGFQFEYDQCGLLVSVSDHAGRIVRYVHDEETMQLVSVTSPPTEDHPQGITHRYFYESQWTFPELRHNILRIEDSNGNVYLENKYEQDPAAWSYARITEQLVGGFLFQFRYTQLQWVPANPVYINISSVRVEVMNPDHGLETFTFNYRGDLLDHRSRLNKDKSFRVVVRRYEFDEQGNLTKSIKPDGSEEINTFDFANTDPRMRGKLLRKELIAASGFPAPSRIIWRGRYKSLYQLLAEEASETGALTVYRYDFDITPGAVGNSGKLIEVIQPTATLPDGTVQEAKSVFEYNSKGLAIANILPDGTRNEIHYGTFGDEADRPILQIFDTARLNIEQRFKYDSFGNISETTDGNGNITRTIYNALGLVSKAIMPMINGIACEYRFQYDADKKLSRSERPKGAFEDMTLTTDYLSDVIERNVLGHPVKTVLSSNTTEQRTVRYQTDYRGLPLEVSYPDGSRIQKTFDERGLQLSEVVIGATGERIKSSRVYDRPGKVINETDTSARTRGYEYDGFSRISTEITPAGSEIKSRWLANDLLESEEVIGEDDTGTRRTLSFRSFAYDEKSRMIKTIVRAFADDPGISNDVSITTFYDSLDRPVKLINSRGGIATKEYDGLGRIIKEADPGGHEVHYTYDANSNLIETTRRDKEPDGTFSAIRRRYAYDARSRRVSFIEPDGAMITHDYDDRNVVIRQTDCLGIVNETFYNSFNNKIGEVDDPGGLNFTRKWTVDNMARVISYTDPMGQVTSFSFDGLGRKTKETYPNGMSITRQHNDKNQIAMERSGSGVEFRYTYDGAGRVATIENSATAMGVVPVQIQEFKYDGVGRVFYARHGTHIVQRSHDSQNRLTSETSAGQTFFCQYNDATGDVIYRWPDGRTEVHAHDLNGTLSQVKETVSGSLGDAISSVARFLTTGPNLISRATYSNGTVISRAYDSRKRVTEIYAANPSGLSEAVRYFYNAADIRQVEAISGQNPIVSFFDFDKKYRLSETRDRFVAAIPAVFDQAQHDAAIANVRTASSAAAHKEQFLYNPADARILYSETGLADKSYSYLPGHRIDHDGSGAYSYHDDGSRQGDPIWTYEVDGYGRVVKIRSATTVVLEIDYDALGRPVLIAEAGKPALSFNYFKHRVVQENHNGVAVRQITSHPITGVPIAYHSTAGTHYPFFDARFNLLGLINSNGDLVETYRYKSFGEPRIFDGSGAPLSDSQFLATPIFGGQRYLTTPKLYLSTRRLMDPVNGVFLSSDPKGYVDSSSLYVYVGQNPVNYFDLHGEEKTSTAPKSSDDEEGWSLFDNPIWNIVTHNGVSLTTSILEEAYSYSTAIPTVLNYFQKLAGSNRRYVSFLGRHGWTIFNKIDSAILYPGTKFPNALGRPWYSKIPFTSKVNAILAPLGVLSNFFSLKDAIYSDKSAPEKGADIAFSSAGLFSSSVATTSLIGTGLKAVGLRGAGGLLLKVTGSVVMAKLALLTGAAAGGYAIGTTLREKTGWGNRSGEVGAAVTNHLLQYDSFLPDSIDTGGSYAIGFTVTVGGVIVEPVGWVAGKVDDALMPEGRTLNPVTGIKSLLSGENPFW